MERCLEGSEEGQSPQHRQSPNEEAKDISDHLQKVWYQDIHRPLKYGAGTEPPAGAEP